LCTVTTNVAVNAPADRPIDLAALDAAIRREGRHRPHCRRCGYGRSRADAGILGRHRCYSCDVHTVEAIVRRLVARVGAKEAVRRLKALAPK
jgi:hypothetical protein